MAAGGSTQHTLRRALGVLKDSTTVGLVKVNSENKGLDVAIIKATNHDEALPKEKHVSSIFNALSATTTRTDVTYCISGLTKRLAKTHSWTVALKTLVVIHRAVREVDHTFHEELVNHTRGARIMFNLSHFRDDSSPSAWDCSAWVRTYALYLEERLECFRMLKYDLQKNHSLWTLFFPQINPQQKTKELDTPELLEQLPVMQQLLFRLLACKPEGLAVHNGLVHYALSIVAGESVKLYVAITDGILNMVDKYFEMERHDAIRALEIYKKAASQGEKLSEFFEMCSSLDFGRRQKYIKIEQPPASFLTSMEEYVAEAPHVLALEWIQIHDDECGTPREVPAPQAVLLIEYKQDNDQENSDQCDTASDASNSNQNEAAARNFVADLLGLNELTQEEPELDEQNPLALAIVPSDNSLCSETSINSTSQTTSWELALVTAPSSNGAAVAASKLAGGMDKLTLDSLYDNVMVMETKNGTNHTGQMASNPFESFHDNQDSSPASSNIPLATNFQKVTLSQEQALLMMQQQQQTMIGVDSSNPFGNPFVDENMPNSFVGENVPLHLPQSSNSSLI
eukprot:XP_015583422.1 putative clathrin assembly protein At5g35200 isoform X1 [Ricinus communis]